MRIDRIFYETAKRNEFFKNLFLKMILNDWDSIVGDLLAQKTQPLRLKERVLIVSYQDSIFASEVILKKKEIIKKLNEKLNGIYIVESIKLVRRSEKDE